MNVNKLFVWVVVLVIGALMLGAVLPTSAQEVTPEAVVGVPNPFDSAPLPEVDTSVTTALIALLGVALVVFGAVIAWALHLGYNSLPKWAQELVIQNREYIYGRVDQGFDLLDTAAARTPTDLDDRIAEIARREAVNILDKTLTYAPSGGEAPVTGAFPNQTISSKVDPPGGVPHR